MRRGLVGTPAELHGSERDRGDQEPRISEFSIANLCLHKTTLVVQALAKVKSVSGRADPYLQQRKEAARLHCQEFVTESHNVWFDTTVDRRK